MALTQEQKNTIAEISQNPIKVLENFKEKPYYLTSFKDEFFQDGTGLLDKVLYQFFLTNNNDFIHLYEYIIKNSSITIFDNKGNKPSALSYIDNIKSSFDNYPNKLFKILEMTDTSNIKHHSYILERLIVDLYNTGMKEKASYTISKYNSFLNGYKNLLISIVNNDDDIFLKSFLKKISLDKFSEIDFHKDLSSGVFKNIFYFSFENKSEKISKFLLDYYPELINNISHSPFSKKQNIPILSVAKDSSLLSEIIIQMDDKTLVQNFNYLSSNSDKILTHLLNHHYSNIIENKTIQLLNSNIESYEKTNLLKSIFESDISYDKKFFLFTSGMDENIKETYSNLSVFNSFMFSVQKKPIIEQNLFDQFINEFKIRNLISEDYVFNSSYFSNMEYFKLVNNNHVFNKINPLNFIEAYLKNNKSREINDDSDYIWFKIAQLNFKNLKSSSNSLNALHIMLVNQMDKYVNFFSTEKLNDLLSKNFLISSYRKTSSSKDFFDILDKLVNTGFSFKEDSSKFLKLLSFNPPYSLLDKIIHKNNISIEYLSEDMSFWNNVNSQETFDYCLKNKASLKNPQHLFSLAYNYDDIPLVLYLKNQGDVSLINEKGNILHELCQYNGNLKKEEILSILSFVPDLALQTNKQNKFPVSYLISDFNKLCKKYKENSNKISQQETLHKYYSVIKSMFECGLQSDNKKAFNTLESQLLKYTDILEVFPDLLPTLRAEKLSKKLESKGIKAKPVKI